MAHSFEDINLPSAAVTRIAKESLPENVAIGEVARAALSRAGSIFALYVTQASHEVAKRNNRKTINGLDVIQAIQETDLEECVGSLQERLEHFKTIQKEKKVAVKQKRNENEQSSSKDNKEDRRNRC